MGAVAAVDRLGMQEGYLQTFESRSLRVAGLLLGTFFVILGLLVFIGGGIASGVTVLLLGLADSALFIRVRLVATRSGIEIRNPVSTVRLRWDEIARFKIGRHGLMSDVCVVERKDGSSSYAFAIQRGLAGVGRKELEMVDQLNGLLRVAGQGSVR